MRTRFNDKHRRAAAASRRLHFVFWLGGVFAYLCYFLILLPLFALVISGVMYDDSNPGDSIATILILSLIFSFIFTSLCMSGPMAAYNSKMHEFEQQSAGEQAEALGASLAHPDDDPLEYRYTNLVAELSLAAGIPAPTAYILRDDDSINAFALSGINDSLALAVSRGALDNLTRDELQAVLAHEFGHIENGDPALYNRLSAMLAGYFSIGSRKGQERLYTDPDTQVLSLSGLGRDSGKKDQFGINAGILYLYGRFLQAAFARHREEMADARAVQYTRDPTALVGALQKAWALQKQGIHPRRPPRERAHIYFIDYRRPGKRLLRTHPTLRERIKTWGGGDISDADLPAILASINTCRSSRTTAPLRPAVPPSEPNPAYPPAAYDRLLAAELHPAPDEPAAALIAYFAYHSGAAFTELERAGVLPGERLAACRRAYVIIEQSEPLVRLAIMAYLIRAALTFDVAEKKRLDPIICRLIQHDGQLSHYELAAFIAWRAVCIPDSGADYRAHTTAIAYLYNYLVCDNPDDPEPQVAYRRLFATGLPLEPQPVWQPLDTDAVKTRLQLCRHCDTLCRLAPTYRQILLNSIDGYYRSKYHLRLPLQQAHLRFALQQTLLPIPQGKHKKNP